MRVISQSVGVVVIIALCMWLRYAIYSTWVLYHEMPVDVRKEFLHLLNNPNEDLYRFYSLFTIGMALTLLIRLSPRGLDYAGYFGGRRYTSHGLTGALYVAAVGEAIFLPGRCREKSLRGFLCASKIRR